MNDTFSISESLICEIGQGHYGSVIGGNAYFARQINPKFWEHASDADKLRGIMHASDIINSLSFEGEKLDPNQTLQFPRVGQTTVPEDIDRATYELAYALLSGQDPDKEQSIVGKSQTSYGSIITQYKPSGNTSKSLGLINATVYRYLAKYLRNSELVLKRV